MKKFFPILKKVLKDFFINPFWKSWQVWAMVGGAFAINGFLWYFYLLKIKENPDPFIFSSGLIFVNLILSNFLWNRERLAGIFLLAVALFTQILMLVFIKNFFLLNI